MKVTLNDNEVRALFTRLDSNHDGNVSQDELYSAIASVSGVSATKGYESTK
jgi:Ca2+-binding EF-hand superfamily protein